MQIVGLNISLLEQIIKPHETSQEIARDMGEVEDVCNKL